MAAVKDHIPALDGLRGFAALIVVVAHLSAWGLVFPHSVHFLGALGVTLFFTLSGFLMAYLHAHAEFGFVQAYTYGVSRFARIVPAYLFVIALSYLIYNLVDPNFVYAIQNHNLIRHVLLSGNVSVFWSIPPEIQFYVFFVFIWWSVSCLTQKKFMPVALLAMMCPVMIYFEKSFPGTTLPSKLIFFLLGAIVGMVRYRYPVCVGAGRGAAILQAVLLVVLVIYSGIVWGNEDRFIHAYHISDEALYFSTAHALICAACVLSFAYPSRLSDILFANKAMRRLGAWSFSLYLLHEPFLQIASRVCAASVVPAWIAAAVAVLMSVLAAYVVHVGIEKPSQAAIKKHAQIVLAVMCRKFVWLR